MTSKNGVGVTEIGHDSELKTHVDGCEDPGCYKRTIKYTISMEQIVAIINQSENCEQFIKYECFNSPFSYSGVKYGWWVSRQGAKMNYWGGAAIDSGKCACGMANSCVGGGNCTCDVKDMRLREDSGYLTDKYTLPVAKLRFGAPDDWLEYGFHTLGKLRCWGSKAESANPFLRRFGTGYF
ncbi:neurexin-4-like [Dendronephthya gigantea]|uniref:neurexin-4-like n=1 Tax=Dendronephthya gigantea TaxID=151771 RepID=UPI00106B0A50|nr:neurexin-4-like [Dendronephthya gigantea]